MKTQIAILFSFVLCGLLAAVTFAQQPRSKSDQKKQTITRVQRPDFSQPKSDIWFDDVFEEGLVGPRPDGSQPTKSAVASSDASATESNGDSSGWGSLVDGGTIEDEIKALNQELAKSVTTPVKFKTAYNDVRQTMSLLSMSFAIVREYDGEVRWKDHAPAAQAAFEKAVISARSNADTSFNYCNARKFDLEDLVRGGSFAEIEKPPAELEWSDVIGRTETMIRLQKSDELLKQWTADKTVFAKQKAKIISEAQWVAAIGEVIAKEGMDDADVDEYVDFCVAMKDAAKETVAATKLDNYLAASKSANELSQSCNNCHEEWR